MESGLVFPARAQQVTGEPVEVFPARAGMNRGGDLRAPRSWALKCSPRGRG